MTYGLTNGAEKPILQHKSGGSAINGRVSNSDWLNAGDKSPAKEKEHPATKRKRYENENEVSIPVPLHVSDIVT